MADLSEKSPIESPESQSIDESEALAPLGRWEGIYRSSWFSIFVTGGAAFCAPGIWAAMNSLGVGGSATPQLVNAANALLYAFMTVTCLLGPFVTRLIGFRYALSIGTLGYPVYAAGLYLNNLNGTQWLVYLGSTLCGISAGIFWSTEGAITTGYPEPRHRGRAVALWLTFRNLGIFVGGCISLALNVKVNSKGSVGNGTYKGFIAIQCLGAPIALLLSNPDQVRRGDGSRIQAKQLGKWTDEAKALWKLFLTKPILLLSPLFWYFGWEQSYPGTYFATYFTVRARALGGFLFSVEATITTWLVGAALDTKWATRQTRAKIVFVIIAAVNSALWIWAVIIQKEYQKSQPTLDWSDQSTFGRGFGVYAISVVALASVENFIYWCIGNLSDAPGDQIRYSALLRGIETAGVAVGFGVQAVPTILIATAAINLGFWFVALPFGFYATIQVVRKFNLLDNQSAQDPALVRDVATRQA